ncbi:MAG: hypothetical protein KGD68_14400 [Candidatus Lokiarchaeota archaeon]|nr:hypothetical protein [Candidatus Lokiarchaeota archaeon]
MVNKELRAILKSIGEYAKGRDLTIKLNSHIFFDILEAKNNVFNKFKERINKDWEEFKLKNQNRVIKKTYSSFFFQYFDELLTFYLQNFCGYDTNSLKLLVKEKISDDNLFLEYSYNLSPEEKEVFNEFAEDFDDKVDGLTTPSGYLYSVITILGVVLRKLLDEKFYIVIDGVILKNGESNNALNFLIVIKNSKDELFKNYYYLFLYYFLKYFKEVPEQYFDKLLAGRERVYQIALDEYSNAKEKLVDLLYYFYKKCNLLENFSPILDFLNFVCSRVEDSVFPKLDIIRKEFLRNFDYTDEKKNSLVRIFDFIDKKSTLYSTFQANNLPSQKSQFNLFLLYTKYYFGSGSLESLEVSDILFFPDEFKAKLNDFNIKTENVINANTINEIQEFLDNFSILTNIENPDIFFKKIFNKELSQLNYDFFKAFLLSLNTSISRLIEIENKTLGENPSNEPLNFKIIVDHVCRMLYTLIDKIFLRKLPSQASKNFIDPRSRYIGKNIALRVLELFIFSDLNVSDDVWPDYIISLNKDALLKDLENYKIEIPEKYFYRYEDIARFVITFNFQSSTEQIMFEEWLIKGLITPIINFISKIRDLIKNDENKTEIYKILRNYIVKDAKHQENLQDIDFVCQQLAGIWENAD